MRTVEVKRINDLTMAEMQREIDQVGCGCCDCYKRSVENMLRQHRPIRNKGSVWNSLSKSEKEIIEYRKKHPYEAKMSVEGSHICCGP